MNYTAPTLRTARLHTIAAIPSFLLVGFAALLAAAPLARAQYTFTNIADRTSPIYNRFGVPSINAGGSLGFLAELDTGGDSGLFTSDGTTTTTIFRVNNPPFATPLGLDPQINAAGNVGFFATLDIGGNGVFTSDGATTTTMGLISGVYSTIANRPSINDAGTLGFQAGLDAGGNGLFTSNGTTTTTIAHTSSPTFSNFGFSPSINSSGTLGFLASLDAGGTGLFTSNGTTTTPIALSSDPTFSFFGGFPSINDSGTLGFQANRDGSAGGGSGVFTSNGTTTTTIALSTSPIFQSFRDAPSINAAGTLAFQASLDAFPLEGIYIGDGTTTSEVIRTGDPLFGSTVSTLAIGRRALNDAGQVAFFYSLANGIEGVAIANAPQSELLGDFDRDGDVDGRDFLAWQRGDSPNPLSADDLADWQVNYGAGPLVAANVAVPEPTTLILLSLVNVGGWVSRRTG